MTMHHRLSIFYYVLLDFDYANKRSDYSEDFAAVSGVPKKYQIFMKGLWLLDRHEFKVCLFNQSSLSQAGIVLLT